MSAYVAVESAFGYLGIIPSIAVVDMERSRLLVTAPQCVAVPIDPVISFSAPYKPFGFDMVSGALVDVWRTLERDDGILPQMRVILRRAALGSDDFQIMLGDSLGGILNSGFYRYYFASPVFAGNGTRDWVSLIPLETPINMTSVNGSLTCMTCCAITGF